jgi:hypothetical protein
VQRLREQHWDASLVVVAVGQILAGVTVLAMTSVFSREWDGS